MKNRNFVSYLATLSLLLASIFVNAQIGGNETYKFLQLPSSARIAAMGGNFTAIKDNDVNTALGNPSLISPEMHKSIGLNFVDYFAGANFGYAAYGHHFEKLGSFAANMQFNNYGKFTYADEMGIQAGEFIASEMALNIGWARALDSTFRIGANIKAIHSQLENYTSTGLAVDVAGSYFSKNGLFTASFILSNIGRQLTTYNGFTEPIPFEIKAAISKRMQHIPLTFSILFTNLQQWDLSYISPLKTTTDPSTGEKKTNEKKGFAGFADKAMRHVVLGAEFRPFKILRVRLGYNYQRRQEMTIPTKPGTVGWSWGIGIRVYKFEVSYARAAHHLHPSFNFFSVSTNLNDLMGI